MVKRIAILGSTGSIGSNALDVISRSRGRLKVVALSAESNTGLLERQAARFRPKAVCVGSAALKRRPRFGLPAATRILDGPGGLAEIVSRRDIDMVLLAISGNACIAPLVEAIKAHKAIALANKEAMVSAGPLIMALARSNGVKILPVDSEHSAIFQCLDNGPSPASRIYLTGSGGPLLNVEAGRFDRLRPEFVLRHPKWKMGRKISVDSATMMNKGLEIIEAQALFGLPQERIDVLIHPEAIVHSMV